MSGDGKHGWFALGPTPAAAHALTTSHTRVGNQATAYHGVMSDAPTMRELDITLDRNSPVPLYYQLARSIESAIDDGTLAPGDRLENEVSLTRRLGLSRPTA